MNHTLMQLAVLQQQLAPTQRPVPLRHPLHAPLGTPQGIFCALHTYGRQRNQHPHIHVSVTRGVLDIKHHAWRQLFFQKKEVEQIWRNAVI